MINIHDFITVVFLLIQFFISGCLLSFLLSEKIDKKDSSLIPKYLIYGIFLNVSILQFWHLFFSVNVIITFIIHFAQIYFVINYKKSKKYFEILKSFSFLTWFCFLLFILWITNLAGGVAHLAPHDSGLYHLPIINWISNYKIIKGLANLSFDYGINSNLFLLISSTKSYPNFYSFLWCFNGIFLCSGFLSFFCVPLNSLIKNECYHREIIFRLILNIPLIHVVYFYYPGTHTDLPVFIIGSTLGIEFFKQLHDKKNSNFFIPVLIFIGISIKISFLLFGFSAFIIFLYLIRKKATTFSKLKFPNLFYLVIFSSVIWFIRGVILSGYLLLPISSFSFPVPWKVDKEIIDRVQSNVINYGIPKHEKNTHFLSRLKDFEIYKIRLLTQHRRVEMFYPLLFGLFAFFYCLISRKKINYIIFIPIVAQLFLWLYIPKNRYSSFASWWFCAHFSSFILDKKKVKKLNSLIPFLVIIISFSFHQIDRLGIVQPLFREGVKKEIPSPKLNEFKTDSGIKLFSPDKPDDRCYDLELFCTPYPQRGLTLFDPDDISKGFFVKK